MHNSPCKTKKCGCEDKGLTTPTPCIHDTLNCPNANPCAETFSACCVIYNKDTIVDLGINYGDNLCDILQILALHITNPLCMDPNAACRSIINLFSTVITPTTVTVGWVANGTPVNYQVEYKLATATSWSVGPLLSNTIFTASIGGLLPNTAYQIRVNSICGSSNCYSATIQILTKPTA